MEYISYPYEHPAFVSAKEKLPDKNGWYLIVDKDDEYTEAYFTKETNTWDSALYGFLENVIGWMPMPIIK